MTMTRSRARGPWFVLLTLLAAPAVASGGDGALDAGPPPAVTAGATALYGVIHDGKGAPVVGATVVATGPALTGTQAAITDERGRYTLVDLPPGTYELHVYYGDATRSLAAVRTVAGAAARVDLAVDTTAVGGEVITISDGAYTVDGLDVSFSGSSSIETAYIKNVPVPGRTFSAVLGSSAGTSADQQARPSAGLMTAATVADADRFSPYLEFLDRHRSEGESLDLRFDRRIRVQVTDWAGRPVNDAAVAIDGQARGRTHADGIWDYIPDRGARGVVSIEAGGQRREVGLPRPGDEATIAFALSNVAGELPRALDLGFAIDATGSMGDEMSYLSAELASIVERIRYEVPGVSIRVGAVIYRDREDTVPLAERPFSTDIDGFVGWLAELEATGGGDYEEDLNSGLRQAMGLDWRTGNAARILVVLADAPPKKFADQQYRYGDAIREASARGIRLLPVAASGADRTVEYLFRAMGVATSTPYVYLTDHSGIGNPHLEADTDRVEVERFNDALVRLVTADLRGEGMHPPGDWQSWSHYRAPPWQNKPRRLVLGAGTGGTYLGESQRFAPLHWVRAGIAFGDLEVRVHLAWSRDFVTQGDRVLMRSGEQPPSVEMPLTLVPGASLRYLFGRWRDVRGFSAMGFEALHAREPARAGEALLFTSQAGLEWQPGQGGQGLALGFQVASHLVLGATTDSMHALPQLDLSGYVDYRF